ncbi:hypothetical protein N7530_011440 [Penicillium desertorum]|uniref:Uncharacterized protein n=1 Tax=Penicillium desertorum TaxID=1303715 RepID=A0A9W9WDF2_9EURO|nr:hypothetical protein N7530_011440 [Penicillium desertorum]
MEEVPILHRKEDAWPFPTAAQPTQPEEWPLRNLPSTSEGRRASPATIRPILLSVQLPAASGSSAFPSIPDDINGFIPESGIESPSTDIIYPYTGTLPVPAAAMPEREEFSPPEVDNVYDLGESLDSQVTEEQNDTIEAADEAFNTSTDNEYKSKVQQQLTTDSWEAQNANHYIGNFLDVLENKSWGNKEASGDTHPIRHPDWVEFYGNGQMRQRPLSKDSFGQVVLACYYAYKCPNSSDEVRQRAKSLLDKWIRYLSSHRWLIHSNYIPNEFEKAGREHANLFEDAKHTNRVTFVGAESFLLYPHELWALKNCAIAIGVPSQSIIPGAAFPFAVDGAVIAPALEELLRYTGDAIEYLYDRLNYSKKWSLELVPGWKDSRVSGTFNFGAFGDLSKSQVRSILEAGVRDTVMSSFKLGTGLGSIMDNVMRPLLPFLYGQEMNTIVRELINQLCPWLDPTVLEQWVAFAIALEGTKQTYKESTAGYAVWPFIMEIESRPYLRVLLEPQLRDLFGFLAQKNNPNGTWAWIARRYDVNAYNKWIKETTAEQDPERFCSRVDYLVLKNLAEKGLPKIPGVLSLSFKGFLDLAARLFREMLDKIWDGFRKGGYIRRWVDDLENIITDMFTPDKVSQIITRPMGEMARVVYRPDGIVKIWKSGPTGTFQSFHSFAKAENGLGHVDNLVEAQERLIDGTLKFWKWGPGRSLEGFGKYIGVPDSGLISGATKVVEVARSALGEVHQVIRSSDGAIQSITNWADGDINGFAKASQRTAQKLCTAAGELLQWTYHPGGSLKEFSKWSKSGPDLSAEAANQVKHAYRQIDGAIDVVEWLGSGVFDRAITYAASLESGLARAADCVLLQIRDINGNLEQWQLDKGITKVYSRWQNVPEDGAAKAVDALVRIERVGEKIVKHLFNGGIAVHTDVLDAAGNVVSSIEGALSDAWDSIKHWHL